MAGASRLANLERGIEGPDSTEGDSKVRMKGEQQP